MPHRLVLLPQSHGVRQGILHLSPWSHRLYWLRFEWQHRGSPHVHGLAGLPQLGDGASHTLHAEIIRHADQLVSTTSPAVLPDGSNIADAPAPKIDPHICNKA